MRSGEAYPVGILERIKGFIKTGCGRANTADHEGICIPPEGVLQQPRNLRVSVGNVGHFLFTCVAKSADHVA